MKKHFETLATLLLVLSAVVLATAAVHREFGPAGAPGGELARATPPAYVDDWEALARIGTWVGDSTAKVRVVEFADFECPFCKRFHESFRDARDSVGKDVALLFVQFPLDNHRFARPAALAAECAEQLGRRDSYHDALFAKQDSFGLKTWTSYAVDARIADTVAFSRCVSSHRTSARIDSGLAAGERFKVRGTPTVLINGWRYSPTPYDSLGVIVRRLARSR